MSRFTAGRLAKPAFAVGACWIAASHFRLGELAAGPDAAASTSGRSNVRLLNTSTVYWPSARERPKLCS